MAFNVFSEWTNDKIFKVTLTGELDANTAPAFRTEIEQAAAKQARRVVLLLSGLDYMASAGVRVLVFAKQKMGAQVDIYVVAPQDSIRETLELTGLQNALYILDDYDAARIEA